MSVLRFCLCMMLPFSIFGSIYAQTNVRLSGYVTASESGECLIGAVVSSGDNWSVTNDYGYYSLNLQKGSHHICCSFLGRQSHNLDLSIQGNTLIHIVMSPFEFLEGAVVEGYQSIIPSAYIGAMEIPVSYVNDMPSILGEPDLMKTLQRMPGVQSGMAGFSGLHVRGGGAEENLVLLDGVSLYNVSHMLGLFSSFTPEAIKQVTLYKGFFPAKYGGRTSSVIDVRTNDGNVKRLGGTVSVGLINSRVHIEGPLVSDKTSFSISARGTNTLAMAPLARGSQFPYLYYFYDLSGKLTHRFGDSDRLC